MCAILTHEQLEYPQESPSLYHSLLLASYIMVNCGLLTKFSQILDSI